MVGTIVGKGPRTLTSGVINENFEEAFSDEKDIAIQSLMFYCPTCRHSDIQRFGSNNFIVSFYTHEDGYFYRHIQIKDGVPTLMTTFFQKLRETNTENIILVGNQFYDIGKGEYLTHAFQEVSLIDSEKGIYYIQDKLALDGAEAVPDAYVDYWNFRMDTNLNLLSFVWSSRGESILQTGLTYTEYLNYRNDRMDALAYEEQAYSKRVCALKTPIVK